MKTVIITVPMRPPHEIRAIQYPVDGNKAVEWKANKNIKINEDDRIFYDTAVEAEAYLITGNIRHFPKEAFIITPAQFLTVVGYDE